MTRRFQQLVSCALALGVVWAGAVGLSPALHVWAEHGGQGSWHTHTGAGGIAYFHDHACPREAGVVRIATNPAELPAAKAFVDGARPVTLFGLQPRDLLGFLGQWFRTPAKDAPSCPVHDGSGHTHNSLAQMLLNGAVEGAVALPMLVNAPEVFCFVSFSAEARLSVGEWYAPTASRGPPVSC